MKVINLETREYEHRLTKWPFFGLGNYALFHSVLTYGYVNKAYLYQQHAQNKSQIKFTRFLFFLAIL